MLWPVYTIGRISLFEPAANLVENLVACRSKACRKPAANLLKTVFSTFHLSSTRTNLPTCCSSRPGFRKKSRKAGRNFESVSQTRTNLSKTWLQTGRKPGLQQARIMACGFIQTVASWKFSCIDIAFEAFNANARCEARTSAARRYQLPCISREAVEQLQCRTSPVYRSVLAMRRMRYQLPLISLGPGTHRRTSIALKQL